MAAFGLLLFSRIHCVVRLTHSYAEVYFLSVLRNRNMIIEIPSSLLLCRKVAWPQKGRLWTDLRDRRMSDLQLLVFVLQHRTRHWLAWTMSCGSSDGNILSVT